MRRLLLVLLALNAGVWLLLGLLPRTGKTGPAPVATSPSPVPDVTGEAEAPGATGIAGPTTSPALAAAAAGESETAAGGGASTVETDEPRTPVIYAPTDEPLNAAEAEALERMRQEFVEAVGGPGQDPGNPDYLRRWLPAQEDSDERFRALFGADAFVQRQIRLNQSPATESR